MKKLLVSIPFFLFLLLFNCKEDTETNLCLPLSVVSNLDSLTFDYRDNKLATIIYYDRYRKNVNAKLVVSYNADGMISKTEYYNTQSGLTNVAIKDEFHYSSGQLVDTMRRSLLGGGSSVYLTSYKHDQNKRLTEISWSIGDKIRYEYNGSNNIDKVYFASNGVEKLVLENTEFDQNSPFYVNSKELKFIFEYRHFIAPNKNNSISTKITNWYEHGIIFSSLIPLLIQFQSPIRVKYLYSYNGKRNPTQRLVENVQTSQYYDFTFQEVKYTCD